MRKTTAVAKLEAKQAHRDDEFILHFAADYNDEANKAWAKYTPAFNVTMVVKSEIAEGFNLGETYIITFNVKPKLNTKA
jgi:hypothetical protein